MYYTEQCPSGLLFPLGIERSWIQMPVKKVLDFKDGDLRYVDGYFRLYWVFSLRGESFDK